MISKNKLKELATYRLQKHCDKDNLFVVEGVKLAQELLNSNFEIKSVCCVSDWYKSNYTKLHNRVATENIFEVTDLELERISLLKTPNQVWFLVERPIFEPIENTFGTFTLALDKIQDPGNLGTIIRIADWFGIRNIVCTEDTANCFNTKVIQSTMGGIFRTNIYYTNLQKYLSICKEKNIPVYGALLSGENIYSAKLQQNSVLLIGNESKGISLQLIDYVSNKISIPNIGGTCESLNASVATGILCYEFFRKQ